MWKNLVCAAAYLDACTQCCSTIENIVPRQRKKALDAPTLLLSEANSGGDLTANNGHVERHEQYENAVPRLY